MLPNLLDMTGFFVSVLINLLLIALICYYFKKKIENLEYSQSEQAKTLYALLSQQNSNTMSSNESKNVVMGINDVIDHLDMSQLSQDDPNEEDASDEDSEDESDDEVEESTVAEVGEPDEDLEESIHMEEEGSDMKEISYNDSEEVVVDSNDNILENDIADVVKSEGPYEMYEMYEKMTVKELKGVLAEKGVQAKSSMVKGDIINMIKGLSDAPEAPVEQEEME